MWLSKKIAAERTEPVGTDGTVSIGGSAPAAVLDGEVRDLTVVSPGGYCWCPDVSDEVLVLQGHLLGVKQAAAKMRPGEICITNGKASVRLTADGAIHLDGEIYIGEERWEAGGGK